MSNKVVSIEERIPKIKQERKKRTNRRILMLLVLFFILIIGILYFQSPLSRVGKISVEGHSLVKQDEIISATGLTKESVILNVNTSQLEDQITQIPEIKDVKIKKVFPNHIDIKIEEYQVLATVINQEQNQLLLENGTLVDSDEEMNTDLLGPILVNFYDDEIIDILVEQLITLSDEVTNSISEIIYSPKETDSLAITVFMNNGYEVRASLRTFAEKMGYYPELVNQLESGVKGIFDLEVGVFFKSYDAMLNSSEQEMENNGHQSIIENDEGNEESIVNQETESGDDREG